MEGLDRRHHIQFGEARDIVRVHHLKMLDPVAAVAGAIHFARLFIAIQRLPDRGVADGVDRDLQARRIGADAGLFELGVSEKRRAAGVRSGIGLQHEGGSAVDHAIHEHLHAATPQHVAVVLGAHVQRLIHTSDRVGVLKMHRHFDTAEEFPFRFQLSQQLKLIEVAVHVMEAGDPV